ncbi:GGDEF domain-containing protein [Paraglaciecola aquimarina]|uniref:diguanylate cyclase n=1 Tax=Paraglaciecola algarum TaxID=3050085 RepID=A0ABS9D679_9ALTE|nr:GGDEF domain-containing protein [Paraglaciecola sp. G1-23]MCF2947543.1 GGDEF domain-containing protein [Paraglaciecola sp. G1-23]
MTADKNLDLALLGDFSDQKSQLKIIKYVCNFTSIVALFYALFFWIKIDQPFIAGINLLFVLAYLASLVLIHYQRSAAATLWFFAVLACHVFILTTQVFTSNTGFHFYYLLFPSGVFLLLENQYKLSKIVITMLATGLFFICEHYPKEPLIELTEQAETWIFSSIILVIIGELGIVMFIFNQMITSRENKLIQMAAIDPLTGLNNRRNFMQLAENIYGSQVQKQQAFCLLLMDLDHFKKINDSYGHIVGDNTLSLVASLIKAKIRPNDILARYGGEEFVLLLPETNLEQAKELAESIRQAVESLKIPLSNTDNTSCTLSIGLSLGDTHLSELTNIIKQADDALYRAKNQGRNCISC